MTVFLEYLFIAGAALFAIGFFWTVAVAFGERKVWGAGVLICPPLAVVFPLVFPQRAWRPALLMAMGVAAFCLPSLVTRIAAVDLGPFETTENGEIQLTLTGWDRTDYSVLEGRSDLSLLQIANPDVTDETLQLLTGMTRLKELDISHTQVTDAGLESIAALPELEVLHASDVAITDDGFRRWLLPLSKLQRLNLRGTSVSSALIDQWKSDGVGRRALK